MSIQLSISEICEEIRHLRDAASDLLDPSAHGVLSEFEGSLRQIEFCEPGQKTDWQLFRNRPLKTRVSKGEFRFGGNTGAHNCFANITSIWNITPAKPSKKQKRSTAFEVCGKASVHVELFDEAGTEKQHALGSWRMELGTSGAPGCYFHTQILGEKDRIDRPFPHSLDVPRLPCFLFTPMAVTEFVLGELFQNEWRSPQRQAMPAIKGWAGIQRKRMEKMFLWHVRQSETAPGSPWIHLKGSIPESDWFLRESIDFRKPETYMRN
jgi:hypothetical protein